MNYNTEVINSVAQQIAEIFKEAVVEQQKAGQGTPVITKSRQACETPYAHIPHLILAKPGNIG
jgi:hypothetical protein